MAVNNNEQTMNVDYNNGIGGGHSGGYGNLGGSGNFGGTFSR